MTKSFYANINIITHRGRMRSLFIRIIPVFILLFCAAAKPSCNVSAKCTYDIESAEFNVDFDKDGNAVITESWSIRNINGDMPFFKKTMDLGIDDIQLLSIMVDNKKIENKESDSSYGLGCFGKNKSELIITKHDDPDEADYKIKYKLLNAIRSEGRRAVFQYIFISKSDQMEIDKVRITVNIPEKDKKTYAKISCGDLVFDGDCLRCEADDLTDNLGLMIDMPESGFDLSESDELKEENDKSVLSLYNSYKIKNASFDVDLTSDKSAAITESFDFEYFKNGELPVKTMDGNDLKEFSFYINDKEVKNTESEIYYIMGNNGKITFLPYNEDDKVSYKIKYVIDNAIMNYDSFDEIRAGFEYCFLNAADSLKAENTLIKVRLCDEWKETNVIKLSQGNYSFDGNTLYCTAENAEGELYLQLDLYSVISMKGLNDPDDITDSTEINKSDKTGFIITIILFIFLLVCFILSKNEKINSLYYSDISINNLFFGLKKKSFPDFMRKITETMENKEMSFMWVPCLYNKVENGNIFFLGIFEMIKDGKAELNDNGIKILKSEYHMYSESKNINTMHKEFIDNLIIPLKPAESGEYYELPYSYITKIIHDKDYSKIFFNNIKRWQSNYTVSIQNSEKYKSEKNIDKLKKDIGKIIQYYRVSIPASSEVYLYDILKDPALVKEIDYLTIVKLLAHKNDRNMITVNDKEADNNSDLFKMCVAFSCH